MRRTHGPNSGHPARCFGCKVLAVNLAPTALGSPDATAAKKVGQGWERDLPAYRALRKQGYQPKAVDGAADLQARANSPHEIEGRPDPAAIERVMDAVA